MPRLGTAALALALALTVVGCERGQAPMAPQAEPQKVEGPMLDGDPDDVIEQVLVDGRPIVLPDDLKWLTDETPVTVYWAPRGDEQGRIDETATWGQIKGRYAGGGGGAGG
jgi:hypothetical protein